MPRLFHRDEWYDQISPTSMLEAEFEQLLIQHATVFHPAAHLVPFKKTVYSQDASAQGDLALIGHDYREWTVIEVEMNRHSLHHHVIPQVTTLKEGRYGLEHAEYLAEKKPQLDRPKLYDMLRGEDPNIVVIVDRPDEEWARELARYGAQLVVFEIFRSDKLKYIFSIDGHIKTLADHVLTELRLDTVLPNMVVVSSPAMLGFAVGDRQSIVVDGRTTEWERIDSRSSCYISTTGTMPLRRGRLYALVMDSQGRMEIIEHVRSRGE